MDAVNIGFLILITVNGAWCTSVCTRDSDGTRSCYFPTAEGATWKQSNSNCTNSGGGLATIGTKELLDKLSKSGGIRRGSTFWIADTTLVQKQDTIQIFAPVTRVTKLVREDSEEDDQCGVCSNIGDCYLDDFDDTEGQCEGVLYDSVNDDVISKCDASILMDGMYGKKACPSLPNVPQVSRSDNDDGNMTVTNQEDGHWEEETAACKRERARSSDLSEDCPLCDEDPLVDDLSDLSCERDHLDTFTTYTTRIPVARVPACAAVHNGTDGLSLIFRDCNDTLDGYVCMLTSQETTTSTSVTTQGNGLTECPNLPTVTHASRTDHQVNQVHVIKYMCDDGYVMTSGNISLTCQKDGRWDGAPPVCMEEKELNNASKQQGHTCPEPENVPHAKRTGNDYQLHREVRYACAPGYKLVSGNIKRVCNGHYMWSGRPPVCKPMHGHSVLLVPVLTGVGCTVLILSVATLYCVRRHKRASSDTISFGEPSAYAELNLKNMN